MLSRSVLFSQRIARVRTAQIRISSTPAAVATSTKRIRAPVPTLRSVADTAEKHLLNCHDVHCLAGKDEPTACLHHNSLHAGFAASQTIS